MNRLTKIVLAIAFVFTTAIIQPATTAAAAPATVPAFTYWWSGDPTPWYVSNIRWCYATDNRWGWDGNVHPTLNEAFENFDEVMSQRSISYYSGPACEIEVHFISFANQGWLGDPGRAVLQKTADGNWIYDADLYINDDFRHRFWTSTNHHWCTVPCGDRPYDLFTIASHEFGHTLGLSHNLNTPSCGGGKDTEQAAAACTNDYYSLDIMYKHAGDGYRRWIQADTNNGLYSLGYG